MSLGSFTRSQRALGGILVLGSAVGFGLNAVLAKLSYQAGASVATLLAVRYLAGTGLLGPLALASRHRGAVAMRPRAALPLAAGYLGSTVAFWAALRLGPVTAVAPLVYLYPAFVALIAALVFGERCGRCQLVAIVLALAGSSLIFGAPTAGGSDLVAKGLGLVAALGAAVYYVAGARGVAPAQALQGAALLCLAGALVFAPLFAAGAGSSRQVAETWPYLALIGVTGTALPLLMAQAGMARIGSTPAALLSLLEPVVVVVLALAILGERMGGLQLAGTLLILASLPLASLERIADLRRRQRSTPPRALR